MSVGFCALIAACALARPAGATMIQLSNTATGSADPALLKATLNFEVASNTLTVTVTNDTSSPNAYRINQILFNSASEATSLTPLSLPDGWVYSTNQAAGTFGTFEHRVATANNGVNSAAILPGDSLTFTFNFTGAGVTASTFLSQFSTGPQFQLVAARFVTGSSGNSGEWGGLNAVPAPGPIALMLGAVLIGMPRRRR